jgi:hypothetical protein
MIMQDKRFWSLTTLLLVAASSGMVVISALTDNDLIFALLVIAYSFGVYQLAANAR